MSDIVFHLYVHLDQPVDNLSLSVSLPNTDPTDLLEVKELLMATKEEVLASIDGVKTSLVELSSDVQRVIDALNEAIAAGDLTAIAAGVAELQTIVTAVDDAVEAVSPEPTEPPVEPTPTEPAPVEPPVELTP